MAIDHLTAPRLDRRDDVVRELHAARDADDTARIQELLDELAHIDFAHQETSGEPMLLTEEQGQDLRDKKGINDGGPDATRISRPNVRDAFNGWLRPYADRLQLRPARRAPLVEALHRRARARLPRPRRIAGSRNSSKDPPPSDPELAREFYTDELSGHRPQPCPWRERLSAGDHPL